MKNVILFIGVLTIVASALIIRSASRAQTAQNTNLSSDRQTYTFVKQYRVEDVSEVRDIHQTKDGGYIFTGEAQYDKPSNDDIDAYITKIDVKGNLQWTKLFQTFHSVKVLKSYAGTARKGEEHGRNVVELQDGSFIVASQGTGFVTSDYLKKKEKWDDVFLAKFNTRGGLVWTKMIGDYATDKVGNVFATKDNGFIFTGYVMQTGFGKKTAPSNFVLTKFDHNGKTVWSKKMDMDNVDIEPLADGGFIALGGVKPPTQESGSLEKFDSVTMPVAVKFNAEFDIEWTKSLEIVPFEESVFSTDAQGHTHMKYRTKRDAAGKLIAIKSTTDGYVALGYLSPAVTGGSSQSTPAGNYSLVAIKLDFSGAIQWAKSIKMGMEMDKEFRETKIIKTTDNGFVFKMNYLPPPRNDQEHKEEFVDEKYQQLLDLCERKHRVQDCDDGNITNDPEILTAWEAYIKTVRSFEQTLNNGLVLLKTDANFNPMWSKKIHLEHYLYGYGIAPTSDDGLIIGGSYFTSRLHYSDAMGQGYYQDSILFRLDQNGQATNDPGLIDGYSDMTIKDAGPYLVTGDLPLTVGTFAFKIDKLVKPKTPPFKTIVTELVPVMASSAEPVDYSAMPKLLPPNIPPITKNWATIRFDGAEDTQEIKPIYKSALEIHQELLPILTKIYAGQVKLKKDVSGGLEYVVHRLVNANDKTQVQQYLEGRGYKTYTNDKDQIVMMKIGRILTITFSVTDRTKGEIFVTY